MYKTLCKPGDVLDLPLSHKMFKLVSKCVSDSHHARTLFKRVMTSSFDGGSSTRWYYRSEKINIYFGERWQFFIDYVTQLCAKTTSSGVPVCPKTAAKMFAMVNDDVLVWQMKLEVAVNMDIAMLFVKVHRSAGTGDTCCAILHARLLLYVL
jgi:hypothetical protein